MKNDYAVLLSKKMTSRENQICKLILKKRRTKEIADDLKISVNTVKAHLANIYRKNCLSGIQDLIIFLLSSSKPLL